ncbi:MAG: aldo/keto reductase [Tractidigestivibacter sp.]|jgi:diketogulonate reductase-like aldo/keto reductase|uniref:aldo/keto reductase n=1 Tax=Tractidigestivibacter sp. TaxID=2847320 RepID=UPI003D94DD76
MTDKSTWRTLNDGNKIPPIGFGVFMMEPDECEKATTDALAAGYRLIDTANAYMNERAVGRAMRASGLDRSEIFLTTKIMPIDFGYEKTAAAIDSTLARLGTDYVDLLLLHIRFGDYLGAWRAMEEALDAGKVRSIGFSNFEEPQIRDIYEHARIMPAVDQIECHPYFQEHAIRAILAEKDVQVECYYPVGHGDARLFAEPALKDIAASHGKSVAQVILRWHVQEGFIPLPKSTNPEHIKANLDIFDFSLTDEEMSAIRALDTDRSYFADNLEGVTEEQHAAMFLNVEHPDYDAQK